MAESLEPFPDAELRDRVRTAVEIGLSAVPVLGSPLQLFVEAVLVPAVEKRRDRWLEKLREVVLKLQESVENFDMADLAKDEAFVSAVGSASRIAMGTHLEEKLNLLKNSLVNMALDTNRDDFLDLQFFRYIDDLSPEHFIVLTYGQHPGAWFDARGITRPNFSISGHRNLIMQADLPVSGAALDIVLRDLADRGLANIDGFDVTASAATVWGGWATELGNELLRFVAEV
jgi:hypothetical protein